MRIPHRPSLTMVAATAAAVAVAAPAAVLAHGDGDSRHGGGPAGTTPAVPSTIALPNAFQPEGIATDGKQLFIGSIPTGAVYRADPKTGQGAVLVPGRAGRAAIGLKVAGGKLVVAGGTTGHAFIYDARSGADIADVTLTSGNSFINDVAIGKCGAYFTDSRQAQLYLVSLGSKSGHGKRGKRFGGGSDHGDHGWGRHHSCKGAGTPAPQPTTPVPTTPEPTTPEPTATSTSTSSNRGKSRTTDAPQVTTIPITGEFQYDADPTTNEANGIVALPHGKQLLVVQSRTGKLFKVDGRTGASVEVPIAGGPLTNGDGLLLHGRWLFAVQNRLNQIAVIKLSRDFASGEVKQTITSPLFRVPTTIALARTGLYAVNARFGTPPSPTTDYDVVRVPVTK